MIIAGTGHRPDKLGGYSDEAQVRLYAVAIAAINQIRPEKVISGMALGWDTALAKAAIVLGYPLIAAVPFVGQESAWPDESKRIYQEILTRASEIVTVSPGCYAPFKMQLRNKWMVDHCDLVVAVWDGTDGGTRNCIKYAESVNKPTLNLYPAWLSGTI